MAGYQKHIGFGIFFYVIFTIMLYHFLKPSPLLMVELLCVTIFGSLFPDIDIKSKGQYVLYVMLCIMTMPLYYLGYEQCIIWILWCALIPHIVKHRGIFHNPLFLGLMLIVIWCTIHCINHAFSYFLLPHFFYFFGGNCSHLILDYGFYEFLQRLQGKKHKKSHYLFKKK